jgi:hypothetical protein
MPQTLYIYLDYYLNRPYTPKKNGSNDMRPEPIYVEQAFYLVMLPSQWNPGESPDATPRKVRTLPRRHFLVPKEPPQWQLRW